MPEHNCDIDSRFRGRFTAEEESDAVLHLQRCENLDIPSREPGVIVS